MHKRSFGWIARKIHNKIKYLKVLTYEKNLLINLQNFIIRDGMEVYLLIQEKLYLKETHMGTLAMYLLTEKSKISIIRFVTQKMLTK